MYTTYAIVDGESVLEYPVNPNLTHSLPPYWLGGELDGKKYAFCHNKEPATDHTQDLIEGQPRFDVESGCWYRQYEIIQASAEKIAQRTAHQTELTNNTINSLRALADEALSGALSDEQRAAWLAFKDAVQAVANQPTFPWAIDWPQRPDVATLHIEVTRL